jgi:glycosyltransferase involved in cell wall biosynthesis
MAQPRPLIAFDARDAFVAMPHGSGIYVRRLLDAMQRAFPPELELWPLRRGVPGMPEVVFEQAGLPLRALARRAALIHGPDSFLPLYRRQPGVVTIHDLSFAAIPGDMPARTERKYRTLIPRVVESADLVICPSSFTANDLEQRYALPRARIRVIPEAPALAVGSAPVPDGRYLLAAGDLRPKKNLAVLVQAFARLHAAGLPHRLVLAGLDLGTGASLQRLAGAAPVELAGFVDDLALDALIRGAETVVVPGIYEGFGLVALDAMVRGRATVLARAGALPETGGEGAAYFEPDDVAELAAVLERLLGSDAARGELGAAGRARAEQFSWEATAAQTVAVYRELL